MLKSVLDILLKVWSWAINRPLLVVRIFKNDPELAIGGLQFEIENQSRNLTSLYPHIQSAYWHLRNGKYVKSKTIYDVCELDRALQPYSPKILTASRRHHQVDFIAPWFLIYKFFPTRGCSTTIRIRNSSLVPLSLWQYWIELFKFRIRGKAIDAGPYSNREYEMRKRSQGPH